jgi:uncharacterized protein
VSASSFDRLSRISAFAPVRRREFLVNEGPHDPADVLLRLGAKLGRNHYGEYAVARQWYATPEVCELRTEVVRLLLAHKGESQERTIQDACDPGKWLFLDTETTGLAGGTGTYAFLIGLAWWEAGGIKIEQLFMRDHDEEHSILLELTDRLKERPVLVTFNGKSFDWPLLQNRFRMTRQIEIPSLAAHLDFLHPARQLWRSQLGSARLRDLEEHVLGFESLGWTREDDIDSSRIPEFYFDFLRAGVTDGVAGVMRHNRLDLRGLAALANRIFQAFETSDSTSPADQCPLELYGISRLLRRHGDHAQARRLCERSLDAGLPEPIARRAKHEAAKLAKRDLDFGRATDLWQQLATSKESSFEALEQLAIYYERRERDYGEAIRITREALSELRRSSRLGFVSSGRFDRMSVSLARRLFRLQQKSQRVL